MSTLTRERGWTLAELAEWTAGAVEPATAIAKMRSAPRITGVSIDSRTLASGDLFVPLEGSRDDGHRFLIQAFARGAAAALCASDHYPEWADREPGPLVVVPDVTTALQRMAEHHRLVWGGLVLGITGSNGKTTTKELVAAALETDRPTLKTEGNLNNHWGVPLTLLRLKPEHQVAVVEMGMNRPGEIAMLSRIARPGAGLITNVGFAHLERLGSLAAIAREKASLGFALEAGQTMFASADSPVLIAALNGARCRIVTFGFSSEADLHPRRIEDLGPRGTRIEVEGFPTFRLPLVGRHLVSSALAALAVAREWGLDPAAVVQTLEKERTIAGRMEVQQVRGATLLVDCYNANPDSTRAALETLAHWPSATRRIAVLGDMLELGEQAPILHHEVGASVRRAELWVTGGFATQYVAGADSVGVKGRIFSDKSSLASALGPILKPGVLVLLKASRGAALEEVLKALSETGD